MNKILLSLLAGIAIGILLAPDKGSETFRKLRGRVDDLKDEAGDRAGELAGKARSAFDKGRAKVKEAFE